jgi:hypothetical protein
VKRDLHNLKKKLISSQMSLEASLLLDVLRLKNILTICIQKQR